MSGGIPSSDKPYPIYSVKWGPNTWDLAFLRNINKIGKPEKYMFLFDTWSQGTNFQMSDPQATTITNKWPFPARRHTKMCNAVMWDNHTESFNAGELLERKWQASSLGSRGTYAGSDSPLPH